MKSYEDPYYTASTFIMWKVIYPNLSMHSKDNVSHVSRINIDKALGWFHLMQAKGV